MIRLTCAIIGWVIVLVVCPELALGEDLSKKKVAENLIQRLKNNPGRLDAEVEAIELFELWDSLGGHAIMDYLGEISKIKGTSIRLKERVSHLMTIGKRHLGDVDGANARVAKKGFIGDWWSVGPFSNEGGIGYDARYNPEENLLGAISPDSSIPGTSGPVLWKTIPKEVTDLGYTDLAVVYSPAVNTCAYALSHFDSPKTGEAHLSLGAGGAFKAYWNGSIALESPKYLEPDPDRHLARVRVRKGTNRLLVKVCVEQLGNLGFYARMTDRNFVPWPGAAYSKPLPTERTLPKRGPKGVRLPQPLAILFKDAKGPNADSRTLHAAARYGRATRSLDRSTNLARDHARTACLRDPSPRNCLLYAELATDPNQRREAIQKCLSVKKDHVPALLALSELSLPGLNPEAALSPLDKVRVLNSENITAEILRIRLLAKRGLLGTAYVRAAKLLKKHPGMPVLTQLAAELAAESGRVRRSLSHHKELLKQRFGHRDSHEVLARAALARGDSDGLEEHLVALQKLWPGSLSVHLFVAEMKEGAGDLEGARKSLQLRRDLAPGNSDTHKTLGLYLLRNGQKDLGLSAFSRALQLNPQDAWLTDYISFLNPAPPFEQPYVISPEKFLARRLGKSSNSRARFLVDQTVVKVHESGLSSTYRQVVVEILNREAAKAWRRYPIQFSPANERVKVIDARVFRKDGTVGETVARTTIPLSEPWYRLYYDVEAEILELPPLEKGDVIELRYRVDDTAVRNEFGNYFGNLVFIEDAFEKDLWRYVLIAPSKRVFYFNDPEFEKLDKKIKRSGNQTTRIFESRGVKRVVQEHAMPGPSSTSSYLHVSTYRSWDELGSWYRGLLRHQLVPDAKIREKVKSLINGKKTVREKVGAIHNFVVTATRYVGLEFGIHGFKPYPVPVIVSRGFGDCKDKASLLVAMLKEAGIDAEFILIRTRDLGHISPFPASLAVFNHAIAYVPSLDMWLDGTAEHFGIDELPFGDQDASVLRIRKKDAIFTRTPHTAPSQNASESEVSVLLDPDGDANLEVQSVASGYLGARLRQSLEVVQTRNERFEAELARTFPGGRLGDFKVSNLLDSSKPVRFTYKAFVPRFAVSRNKRIEIPVDVGLNLTAGFGRSRNRTHDIVVGPTYATTKRMKIEMPTGYEIEILPSTAIIETRFGKLRFEPVRAGNSVQIKWYFELTVHRVTSTDYPAFVDFCKQVDEVMSGRIVLTESR